MCFYRCKIKNYFFFRQIFTIFARSFVTGITSSYNALLGNAFALLKYKIIQDAKILNTYLTVDEGIENRILKYINNSNSWLELVMNIKTKRYTYNKINRMFIHILTSLTKEEARQYYLKNNQLDKETFLININTNEGIDTIKGEGGYPENYSMLKEWLGEYYE